MAATRGIAGPGTAGRGRQHADGSGSVRVRIATGPQIIQSPKHFPLSSSSSPASIRWLPPSCPLRQTLSSLTRRPLPLNSINTQFPWLACNLSKRVCSLLAPRCKSFYAAFVQCSLLWLFSRRVSKIFQVPHLIHKAFYLGKPLLHKYL